MKFTDKRCTGCGCRYRPTNGRQRHCPPCRTDTAPTATDTRTRSCQECGGRFTGHSTRCPTCQRSNPPTEHRPEIPTPGKLPGQHNPELARFALTLADKALRHTADQHGYAANLVRFARHASTGTIPPDRWQIEHLGHRVTTRRAA
ncbi:MAG: hypothetical protein ACRDSL_14865 [Pseudonocardiaceae bacterium]